MILTATYNPLLAAISINEIKRYAGLHHSDFSQELLTSAANQARILAQPQASWHIYSYDTKTAAIHTAVTLNLPGNAIKNHLQGAMYVAVLSVTIGNIIEAKVTEHFSVGKYTLGLLLDAAGTAAVEAAADQTDTLITAEAAKIGCHTTSRFSPGYGDFAVQIQPKILALAEAEKINITAAASAMLQPRKSITALIGLVPKSSRQASQTATCQTCNKKNCLARKETS